MPTPSRPPHLSPSHVPSPALSDHELLNLCETYGREALTARRKFAGLLPEVAHRRLYLKKNCSSIYMFAALLAGMSHKQVDVVLRLEKHFQNKPVLSQALVGGEVSVNKLVRIVPLITEQNQQELLNRTKELSNRALEIFVREQKIANTSTSRPVVQSPQTLHVQTLTLAPDVQKELEELQGKGIDINQMLRKMLQSRREQIASRKAEFDAEEQQKCADLAAISKPASRHIPRKIIRVVQAEFGNKCGRPGCSRPAAHFHHRRPFAKYGTHSPYYLEPLCLGHHELEHADSKLISKFKSRLPSA